MNNPISNDVFDSRDLEEYKEYLESELIEYFNNFQERTKDDFEEAIDINEVDLEDDDFIEENNLEIEHYKEILDFIEELDSSEYLYGMTIIHKDYFTEYAEEMVKDCGYIPNDLPMWIENHIDWDGVASEVEQDYTTAEYKGDTYYFRQ